jgi:Domain of unknown function (DUF6946)
VYPLRVDCSVTPVFVPPTGVAAVEGKVAEPFGPLVSEWLVADAQGPSPGKLERLAFLCERLSLNDDDCQSVRYQLLHRTVSGPTTSTHSASC